MNKVIEAMWEMNMLTIRGLKFGIGINRDHMASMGTLMDITMASPTKVTMEFQQITKRGMGHSEDLAMKQNPKLGIMVLVMTITIMTMLIIIMVMLIITQNIRKSMVFIMESREIMVCMTIHMGLIVIRQKMETLPEKELRLETTLVIAMSSKHTMKGMEAITEINMDQKLGT